MYKVVERMFHEEEAVAVEGKGLYYQINFSNQRYSHNCNMCILFSINVVPVMYSNKSDRCLSLGKYLHNKSQTKYWIMSYEKLGHEMGE